MSDSRRPINKGCPSNSTSCHRRRRSRKGWHLENKNNPFTVSSNGKLEILKKTKKFSNLFLLKEDNGLMTVQLKRPLEMKDYMNNHISKI